MVDRRGGCARGRGARLRCAVSVTFGPHDHVRETATITHDFWRARDPEMANAKKNRWQKPRGFKNVLSADRCRMCQHVELEVRSTHYGRRDRHAGRCPLTGPGVARTVYRYYTLHLQVRVPTSVDAMACAPCGGRRAAGE